MVRINKIYLLLGLILIMAFSVMGDHINITQADRTNLPRSQSLNYTAESKCLELMLQ